MGRPKKQKSEIDIMVLEIRKFFDDAMEEHFGNTTFTKKKRKPREYPYLDYVFFLQKKEEIEAQKSFLQEMFVNALTNNGEKE